MRHECHDYSDTDMIQFGTNLEVYKKARKYFLQVYIASRHLIIIEYLIEPFLTLIMYIVNRIFLFVFNDALRE